MRGCRGSSFAESLSEVSGEAKALGRKCRAGVCMCHEGGSCLETGWWIYAFLAINVLCRTALDMRNAINESANRMSQKSMYEAVKPSGCPMVAEISVTPCEAVQATREGWGGEGGGLRKRVESVSAGIVGSRSGRNCLYVAGLEVRVEVELCSEEVY